MKRTLIVLSLLGLTSAVCSAQTQVTVYGTVDTGLIKESGSDVYMGENATNMIGFKGVEDLGNGMKASFQLERRFQLNDGTQRASYNFDDVTAGRSGVDWTGAANVGLSGAWGSVRLGRVNEMSTEYFSAIDPFGYGSTGAALSFYNALHSDQISNTTRYDSPEWAGFSFGLTYSLGRDTQNDAADRDGKFNNDGYGASLRYDNGPLYLTANYSRMSDSNKSFVYNLGGAYTIGDWRISAGFQNSKLKAQYDAADMPEPMHQKEWLVGLQYNVGAGTINASYNRANVSESSCNGNVNKYALGYTYNLSKRTSLYSIVSYTDSDNDDLGSIYNNNGVAKDSVTGVQIGMTHNF